MKITIESSIALSAEQQANLEEKLAKQLKATIKPSFVVDSSLLGGLRITTPTKTYDLSIKSRLSQLSEELNS